MKKLVQKLQALEEESKKHREDIVMMQDFFYSQQLPKIYQGLKDLQKTNEN